MSYVRRVFFGLLILVILNIIISWIVPTGSKLNSMLDGLAVFISIITVNFIANSK